MEMLYRLSYEGAHNRDHPSGQHDSDAKWRADELTEVGRLDEPRRVRKRHTTPKATPFIRSRLGCCAKREI